MTGRKNVQKFLFYQFKSKQIHPDLYVSFVNWVGQRVVCENHSCTTYVHSYGQTTSFTLPTLSCKMNMQPNFMPEGEQLELNDKEEKVQKFPSTFSARIFFLFFHCPSKASFKHIFCKYRLSVRVPHSLSLSILYVYRLKKSQTLIAKLFSCQPIFSQTSFYSIVVLPFHVIPYDKPSCFLIPFPSSLTFDREIAFFHTSSKSK